MRCTRLRHKICSHIPQIIWDHEYDVVTLRRWIIPFLIRAFSLSHQTVSIETYPRKHISQNQVKILIPNPSKILQHRLVKFNEFLNLVSPFHCPQLETMNKGFFNTEKYAQQSYVEYNSWLIYKPRLFVELDHCLVFCFLLWRVVQKDWEYVQGHGHQTLQLSGLLINSRMRSEIKKCYKCYKIVNLLWKVVYPCPKIKWRNNFFRNMDICTLGDQGANGHLISRWCTQQRVS